MAEYEKQTWEDYDEETEKGTRINANRMDHIEQGIYDATEGGNSNSDAIDELNEDLSKLNEDLSNKADQSEVDEINQSLSDKAPHVLLNAQSDLFSVLSAYGLYNCGTLCTRNNASSTLTNGATSNVTRGIFCQVSTSYVDYVLFAGGVIYFGRLGENGVTQLYTISGTSTLSSLISDENSEE